VIAGGADALISPLGVAGFSLLGVLSRKQSKPEKASRPFDQKRDGFVLGEGAGILIVEEEQHARERGVRICGEISGYGCTSNAFRITDISPDGEGAAKAMEAALVDGGITPSEVDYINAHGTSTVQNDKIETMAIKKVFGEYAYKIPVSSIKSMMGHTISASGVLELIATLSMIQEGVILPTINYEYADPACDLDYVPNVARHSEIDVAISNSFAFGGHNNAILVRRYEEREEDHLGNG